MAHTTHQMTSVEMQQCIDECLHCHAICLQTAQHCLQTGGEHAEQNHMTLLLDCAEICQTSANFMLRGSQQHTRTCAVCAEICRACEEDCRRLGRGDDVMLQCAEACRRCAQSCDRMAKMAA